jgi:hypothetical protein
MRQLIVIDFDSVLVVRDPLQGRIWWARAPPTPRNPMEPLLSPYYKFEEEEGGKGRREEEEEE